MDASEGAAWFLGDLSDPWVISIADILAESRYVHRTDCTDDLPDRPLGPSRPPRVIVLHRNRLTALDAERLKSWRDPEAFGRPPALILCVSPYVRYAELERYSGLVDLVIPEATAVDVLPRRVAQIVEGRDAREKRNPGVALRIEVSAGNAELGQVLVEVCRDAGHQVDMIQDLMIEDVPRRAVPPPRDVGRVLTIWEAPVLEPEWSERIERRARLTGPVIALMGFADRTTVARAKACGAVACLDLPLDVGDLMDVIDRRVGSIPQGAWPVPHRVEHPHAFPRPPRRRSPRRDDPQAPVPWSGRGSLPTIP